MAMKLHLLWIKAGTTMQKDGSEMTSLFSPEPPVTHAPVRYAPDVETIAPDEDETLSGLKAAFGRILDTTSKDYGHAVRGVHAKSHGIARGTLTVAAGLPAEFAQGMFRVPGEHEAILRISTNPGDILDDAIALPRGLALKVLGVEGERLPGSEDETTQDFLMVNGPVFSAATPKAFLTNLKRLAGTTDRVEGVKKALSAVASATERVVEAFGGRSATLIGFGGAKQVHPLGETYYTQTPYRYGDYMAKIALFPVSPGLTTLTGTIVAIDAPDAIRTAVTRDLIEQGGTWELRVQLNRDLDTMPIEDPTVLWDEDASPFVTVATLVVEPQLAWETGVTEHVDDALSYSPWHGLAAHRPLGGVNRVRRGAYDFSADYRGAFNGCPMHEPRILADLP